MTQFLCTEVQNSLTFFSIYAAGYIENFHTFQSKNMTAHVS